MSRSGESVKTESKLVAAGMIWGNMGTALLFFWGPYTCKQ